MDDMRDEYIKAVTVGKGEPFGGEVILENNNPRWRVLFRQEADRISSALGNTALQIHHVGSTSVPGLCAKPIIDILLVVADSSDESSYIPALESAGYTMHIREPDWHQHRLLKGSNPDVNLHVFSENAAEIERMLRFRDWLRSNENDKLCYENVKRKLAKRSWAHIQQYADAKTAIVDEILARSQTEKYNTD